MKLKNLSSLCLVTLLSLPLSGIVLAGGSVKRPKPNRVERTKGHIDNMPTRIGARKELVIEKGRYVGKLKRYEILEKAEVAQASRTWVKAQEAVSKHDTNLGGGLKGAIKSKLSSRTRKELVTERSEAAEAAENAEVKLENTQAVLAELREKRKNINEGDIFEVHMISLRKWKDKSFEDVTAQAEDDGQIKISKRLDKIKELHVVRNALKEFNISTPNKSREDIYELISNLGKAKNRFKKNSPQRKALKDVESAMSNFVRDSFDVDRETLNVSVSGRYAAELIPRRLSDFAESIDEVAAHEYVGAVQQLKNSSRFKNLLGSAQK